MSQRNWLELAQSGYLIGSYTGDLAAYQDPIGIRYLSERPSEEGEIYFTEKDMKTIFLTMLILSERWKFPLRVDNYIFPP